MDSRLSVRTLPRRTHSRARQQGTQEIARATCHTLTELANTMTPDPQWVQEKLQAARVRHELQAIALQQAQAMVVRCLDCGHLISQHDGLGCHEGWQHSVHEGCDCMCRPDSRA